MVTPKDFDKLLRQHDYIGRNQTREKNSKNFEHDQTPNYCETSEKTRRLHLIFSFIFSELSTNFDAVV